MGHLGAGGQRHLERVLARPGRLDLCYFGSLERGGGGRGGGERERGKKVHRHLVQAWNSVCAHKHAHTCLAPVLMLKKSPNVYTHSYQTCPIPDVCTHNTGMKTTLSYTHRHTCIAPTNAHTQVCASATPHTHAQCTRRLLPAFLEGPSLLHLPTQPQKQPLFS
jgi:hypothetical protein